MPRPPPPATALTSSGKPSFRASAVRRASSWSLAQIARRAGHACRDHAALGQGLVTHGFDGRRRWADEDQARVHAGLGKGRVFTQEAVAGVNGVGAGLAGGFQQGVDAQVGVRGGGSADPDGFVGQRDMRVPPGRRR
jgi:hypothetical protein